MALLILSCRDNDISNIEDPVIVSTAQKEIEIQWISRIPNTLPPSDLQESKELGWPSKGQSIEWVAHVNNATGGLMDSISFHWKIDGKVIEEGIVSLKSGKTKLSIVDTWEFERRLISLHLEWVENGNVEQRVMEIYSDALSVIFDVDQTIYNWLLSENSIRFEKWAYAQVSKWNSILTNHNCLDRLRIESIGVVSGESQAYKNRELSDFYWYFGREMADPRFLNVNSNNSVVGDQTIVLHELLHQRGLVDIYAYVVLDQALNGSTIDIIDSKGRKVAGTTKMPYLTQGISSQKVYKPDFDNVLMGHDYTPFTSMSKVSVHGLNRYAGFRTPIYYDQVGNAINRLTDGNIYLSDLPDSTEVSFVYGDDKQLEVGEVDVFFDKGDEVYVDAYQEQPDTTYTIKNGVITILKEVIKSNVPHKYLRPNVVILRVRKEQIVGYTFLPVYYLNNAYLKEQKTLAKFQLNVDLD